MRSTPPATPRNAPGSTFHQPIGPMNRMSINPFPLQRGLRNEYLSLPVSSGPCLETWWDATLPGSNMAVKSGYPKKGGSRECGTHIQSQLQWDEEGLLGASGCPSSSAKNRVDSRQSTSDIHGHLFLKNTDMHSTKRNISAWGMQTLRIRAKCTAVSVSPGQKQTKGMASRIEC